ncbi:hypothetical protein R6Q59_015899 [Mikania micrantha]
MMECFGENVNGGVYATVDEGDKRIYTKTISFKFICFASPPLLETRFRRNGFIIGRLTSFVKNMSILDFNSDAQPNSLTDSALNDSDPLNHSDILTIQHLMIQIQPNGPLVF